ncbi:MAG: dipeptidase [Desulfurococcaceae archaeon TW002]
MYPIVDLHEDVSTYFLTFGSGQPLADFSVDVIGRDADIPKYVRGNVRIVFSSVFPGTHTFDIKLLKKKERDRWLPGVIMRYPQLQLFEHIKIYYSLSEAYDIKIIESIKDVDEIIESSNYRLGFLIHVEGADAIDDPYDLVILKKLGVRSLGITWNYNNKWASSCFSIKDYGLTPDGEELIKYANKLGIVIDLAHASKKTVIDVLQVSKKPVMISHANVKSVHDHKRNVDDEILELLSQNKGVLGLSFVSSFISPKKRSSLNDLINHFMYVYERFGSSILAIGSDFHGLLGLPGPEGLESVDKIQILLETLRSKGLSESDIRKIAYENALSLMREILS